MTKKISSIEKNTKFVRTPDLDWLSSRDKQRIAYREWLKQEQFEFFIVLKFYDGTAISDEVAKKRLRLFLNKLDRHFIERRELERFGKRIERMVFIEHGEGRENTHFNVYMRRQGDFDDLYFRRIVMRLWRQTTYSNDLKIKCSDNDDAVCFYSTKELDSNCSKEMLVADCCYLSTLRNNDLNAEIRQQVKIEAQRAERNERVKAKLRISKHQRTKQLAVKVAHYV